MGVVFGADCCTERDGARGASETRESPQYERRPPPAVGAAPSLVGQQLRYPPMEEPPMSAKAMALMPPVSASQTREGHPYAMHSAAVADGAQLPSQQRAPSRIGRSVAGGPPHTNELGDEHSSRYADELAVTTSLVNVFDMDDPSAKPSPMPSLVSLALEERTSWSYTKGHSSGSVHKLMEHWQEVEDNANMYFVLPHDALRRR
mmetsp:Transcript_30054/g.82517  ORF Transcript_30054/g.82517 Transcript_30054/m.82517 type:complete len:204 (-) Transcript_30054:53-664(-)|eukprot:CAMPEP_0117539230 /NCGR_PEP_ID=MMETSP0784-20121206/42879_1 /TAXON_ID=39447 /ORGANISM="" /LENGTH=203 /DNA_ID=CAMNT_0005335853 /DNA_START=87 /DNA_END=698 /DNA_ORIENTATION=+